MNDNDILFRFLLTQSRWNIDSYTNNSNQSLDEAVKNLDINSNNISVFLIKKNNIENGISDLDIISFLFSASVRTSLQKFCYIDISFKTINSLGLKIKKIQILQIFLIIFCLINIMKYIK
ncbi:MAG: hypothetical protein JXB50_05570 [Spirochaetes bacterium]|nr:hypothetical protein [Spirochaetota bacterium]